MIRFFVEGGSVMFIILFCLLIGLSIMIERIIYIRFKNRIDTETFVNRLTELIKSKNITRAVEYCSQSDAALPRIVKAGILEYGKSSTDIQNAMELAALTEIPKLEKRTQYLSMVANVATLLGLLGTIFGLIASFHAVMGADAADKATLLSAGIAVAMNTTAFGLMVAIPCLVVYSYLVEKTNELVDEINETVARIYRYIVASR
ncbi:MotA/TolQ/ExbB proton channel family protein [candidate division KSB1 bacterium]|nr:MotA/TolQ/ExbB proton channel family protein [candidate division KSB1 bacterium]